jgi:hypothetical protein
MGDACLASLVLQVTARPMLPGQHAAEWPKRQEVTTCARCVDTEQSLSRVCHGYSWLEIDLGSERLDGDQHR